MGIGPHADNQRRSLAGTYQLVGMTLLENSDSVGANHVLQSALHGGEKVTISLFLRVLDELHQHFGIGLGAEVVTLLLQHGAEGLVVLNDAVMHQREVPALREVRMGVDRVGLAMGGPAGMGDADSAGDIFAGAFLSQRRHLTSSLIDIQFAFGVNH